MAKCRAKDPSRCRTHGDGSLDNLNLQTDQAVRSGNVLEFLNVRERIDEIVGKAKDSYRELVRVRTPEELEAKAQSAATVAERDNLRSPEAWEKVVADNKKLPPIPTPTPEAYLAAVESSAKEWYEAHHATRGRSLWNDASPEEREKWLNDSRACLDKAIPLMRVGEMSPAAIDAVAREVASQQRERGYELEAFREYSSRAFYMTAANYILHATKDHLKF